MTHENTNKTDDDYKLLDRVTVKKKLLWKSDTTLYDAIRDDNFPLPIKVGKRRSAWFLREVNDWIDKQPRSSDIRRK